MAPPRVRRLSALNWGQADGDRLAVPRFYGTARLAAIAIAGDSQQDQAFVVSPDPTAPAIGSVGVRSPYIADPFDSADLALAPQQLYLPESVAPALLLNITAGGTRAVLADRVRKYCSWGAYLSVVAYYGSLPPSLPIRRDPLQLYVLTQVAAGAIATRFRCITSGRDKSAICILGSWAGYAGLVWELYGSTEGMQSGAARTRDLLANGVGGFSRENLDGFDAFELDMRDPGGPYNADVRFTTWDS